MKVKQAVAIGLAGNEVSKIITGTSEVSPARTAVATTSGAIIGTLTSGVVIVGAGVTLAPIAIPMGVAGGIIAGMASLFD